MKKWLLIGLVVAVVAAGIGLAVGVRQLRPALAQQLERALQSPVTIQSVGWAPPFGLRLQGLVAQSPPGFADRPWLRVAGVQARVAPWALLGRRVVVDLIVTAPELFVQRRADGRWNLPALAPRSAGEGGALAVVPRTVRVQDGVVTAADEAAAPGGVTVRVDQLRGDVRLAFLPVALRARALGILRAPDGRPVGQVEAQATATADRSVRGVVTLTHQAIQHLAPYVQQAIGAPPTAGAVTLRAEVTGQGETVTIPIHLEAQGVAFPPEAMTVLGVPAQQLAHLLQDDAGRIQVDFTVSGRWDHLQVSWDRLIASALQQALRHAMARHLQQVITEGLPLLILPPAEGEASPSLEDRLKQLGRDLKRSLKDAVTPPVERGDSTP